jgi:hypothetical protein
LSLQLPILMVWLPVVGVLAKMVLI